MIDHVRRNLVAYLALFVALGGSSYAATSTLLPANSVGTRQVIDHSLLRKDFKASQMLRGARGPVGAQGPAGPQGPVGPPGPAGKPDTSSFYTKSQSDGRYLGQTAKAVDADKLDGLDSTAFSQIYSALVDSDGTLLVSKGFASSKRTGAGDYTLKLEKAASPSCQTFASLRAGTAPIGQISADGPAVDGTVVTVWTANGAGALADRQFRVAVIC